MISDYGQHFSVAAEKFDIIDSSIPEHWEETVDEPDPNDEDDDLIIKSINCPEFNTRKFWENLYDNMNPEIQERAQQIFWNEVNRLEKIYNLSQTIKKPALHIDVGLLQDE